MDNVITINGIEWTVKEASCDELKGKIAVDGFILGVTMYDTNEIFVGNWLSDTQKKRTLRHELAHAFLFSNGFLTVEKFNVEALCEFIAVYGGEIERIREEIYP